MSGKGQKRPLIVPGASILMIAGLAAGPSTRPKPLIWMSPLSQTTFINSRTDDISAAPIIHYDAGYLDKKQRVPPPGTQVKIVQIAAR